MLPPTRSVIGEIKGHLISLFRDLTGGPLNAINWLSIVLFQTFLFAIHILKISILEFNVSDKSRTKNILEELLTHAN